MIPKNINGKSYPPIFAPKIFPTVAGNIERFAPSHMKLRITNKVYKKLLVLVLTIIIEMMIYIVITTK
jgi:hypothetical protein